MRFFLAISSLLVVGLLFVTDSPASGAAVMPVDLRCESLQNPLGIQPVRPRLSWRLQASDAAARGDSQAAYQILVADSKTRLSSDRGNLWDTGKVASDQSLNVVYAGQPLSSTQACWWKVRVWDQDGNVSAWSAPARWTIGLLHPDDWRAKWIGRDVPPPPAAANPLVKGGAQWIWHPGEHAVAAAPPETRYFRRAFTLPADRTVRRAQLIMAADNRFAVAVNGTHAGQGGSFKTAVVMDVTKNLHAGRNVVAGWVKNVGENANPAGLVGLLRVEFTRGDPVVITTDACWRSHDRETGRWTALDYDDSDWSSAEVVAPIGGGPWGDITVGSEDRRLPARMLRKEFAVTKPIARAMVYYSGLGLSELYLNGRKVGNHVLSPALTDYTKRVAYLTFDVTHQIAQGTNAMGVWLGNGRFYAPRAMAPTATVGYGYPKLLMQLVIEYADGSRDVVISDASWKLTTDGPIQANNEYDGEQYDARREMPGWDRAGFDDHAWRPAQVVSGPAGRLVAPMDEPIRVTGHLQPRKVTEPKPGMFIFDLGQNMVGWCRLKVAGPAGTTVTLRHAEMLRDDGTLYVDNLRSAKVTDTYTLKGRGTEIYMPRFTYHGFRYVEVTGYPGRPALDAIEGCVVNDDVPSAGSFTCSNALINQIYKNVTWGVRGNYRSMPTDCPQRDERQGWLGDRAAECKGESFLFQNGPLYAKWVRDMIDAQKENGSVSDVCPAYWPLYTDNVVWPSALILASDMVYEQFGDLRTITRAYPSMVKWIDHMSGFITADNIMPRDRYGDWCVPPEDPKLIHSKDPARNTAGPILGTTYFYHCLNLMTRYATLLGKPADAARFAALAQRLKDGLNAKYLNRKLGQYDNGTQTTSVLPLAFNMVPDDQRQAVFDHLVHKITVETHGHLGTGLVGGQWLNRVLTTGGRPDLVYGFLTKTDYPSWGYMVKHNATTVWELWNGNTADPAMNSGNHVMLVGDMIIWLFEDLAGIQADPNQPGFKHILMKPTLVGDLKFVKATHQSPYGLIASDWRRDGHHLQWRITVPPNTTATVWVPAGANAKVRESGQLIATTGGATQLRRTADRVVLKVLPGSYRFDVDDPNAGAGTE